ncbi:MAG: AAA family ATPase [Candidatus Acidiferrales bacterium]
MILDFYNLDEQPFGVTPDPRYLYLSPTHREALASLLYGITAGRGFVGLIAKPGMGKTTLLFQVLKTLQSSARTVFLFQTLCSPHDFLRSLLADLGVEDQGGDLVQMHSKLNEVLVRESKSGKRFVVVIDEAQNLTDSVLEVVRMLSNFETPREKLMQIVLAGQPQLASRLASPNLVQLRQRISIFGRLTPLTLEETGLYINHRLRVAGYASETPLFTDRAIALIAGRSEGIPRNINNICFNALSLGCAQKQRTIDRDAVEEVLRDLDLGELDNEPPLVSKPAERIANGALPFQSHRPARRGWRLTDWIPGLAIAAAAALALTWAATAPNREMPKASSSPLATVARPSVKSPARPAEAVPRTPSQDSTHAASPADASVKNPYEMVSRSDAAPTQRAAANPDRSRSILVSPNETLSRISRETFGTYNHSIVEKIRELNPGITDPDLILSGQKLRLPPATEFPASTDSTAGQAPTAQTAHAEKP